MKCVFCGKIINDDLIFCPYCGRKTVIPEPRNNGYAPESGNRSYAPESENRGYVPETESGGYEPDHRDNGYAYGKGNGGYMNEPGNNSSRNTDAEYDIPQRQRQEYSSQYGADPEDDMIYYADEYDDYTQDNDDALFYDKKSPMYNGYRNRNSRKKSNNNIALIVLAVVLALVVAGTTCWLLIAGFSDNSDDIIIKEDTGSESDIQTSEKVYNCSICKKEMPTDKKYCDECVADYTCVICDQVSKDTRNGFCDDCSVEYKCRSCNKIDEDVKDGYCPDCFTDLKCKGSGCNNVIKTGYYCSTCIKNNVSEKKCYICNEIIDDSAIYLIDSKGRPYCRECDTGRYCSKCHGYLTDDIAGDVCPKCIQFNCGKCGKTMGQSEVAVSDSNGKAYCENCDTGFYCETCGAPIKNNEIKCKNCSEENN